MRVLGKIFRRRRPYAGVWATTSTLPTAPLPVTVTMYHPASSTATVKSWEKVLSPGHLPTQYESPALAKDLAGLPPLFSYIGQLDPGRDENIAYWTRMMEAGVPVEYHVFPGCYHCFELSVPEADYSKAAYALSYAALRRAFYGEA